VLEEIGKSKLTAGLLKLKVLTPNAGTNAAYRLN